jgi:hypothetical protein
MSMKPQHVVILTGGGLPDEETPGPHRNDVDLALQRAGCDLATVPDNAVLRQIVAEAFKVGYHQAAMLHRVVAVWVLPDQAGAERFAKFVTAEVDPAYVRQAGDPLAELLTAYDNSTGRIIT